MDWMPCKRAVPACQAVRYLCFGLGWACQVVRLVRRVQYVLEVSGQESGVCKRFSSQA